MRPITVTQAATGTLVSTAPISLDHYRSPFNVGLGVVVVSGTPTYTVQHTFDDVLTSTTTPTYFDHPVLVSRTTSADGNYAFPVTAIRLSVVSGTGTVRLTVIQAGMPGL